MLVSDAPVRLDMQLKATALQDPHGVAIVESFPRHRLIVSATEVTMDTLPFWQL